MLYHNVLLLYIFIYNERVAKYLNCMHVHLVILTPSPDEWKISVFVCVKTEVGQTVLFLASDRSSFVTGATYTVAGGSDTSLCMSSVNQDHLYEQHWYYALNVSVYFINVDLLEFQ